MFSDSDGPLPVVYANFAKQLLLDEPSNVYMALPACRQPDDTMTKATH